MQQVTIDEAKAHLLDLIEAALNGVEVVIAKDEQPVVKLVPVTENKPRRRAGSAKGLIKMSDDFDEPLEEFKEYME
jgi:antitoxin (DNA-binding transcriptional repressor) of toxin-antitoxin stability system